MSNILLEIINLQITQLNCKNDSNFHAIYIFNNRMARICDLDIENIRSNADVTLKFYNIVRFDNFKDQT